MIGLSPRGFQSREEFHQAVELLNALCDESRQFQLTRANKDHRDEFDDTITRGQSYFKRELGGGFGHDVKLSEASMAALCACLFPGNILLGEIAQRLATQRADKRAELQAIVTRLMDEE